MDIDPYAVLGLLPDASLPQIKSAHRKLVLKCHPDKIKDDALRNDAQNEFQRVQHAYELLSDASRRTKYDQKVRLAELRRQMKEEQQQANAHASKAREYRNGRFYEERMPADAFDFDDEPIPAPSPSARKHDDWARRPREERKKSSKSRDASTSYSSRAKYRTKERRRETFEKYAPYVESEGSDSGASYVYVKRPEDEQPSPRKSKPTAAPPPPPPTEDKDDDCPDHYESKHEKLHTTARDYIRRSKDTAPVEIDSRHRPSRSPPHPHPRDYEPAPGGTPRSKRPSRESVRPSPSSRHGSYEHLDSSSHPPPPPPTSHCRASYEGIKIPSMPTVNTTPPLKGSSAPRPPLQPSRSATTAAAYARSAAKRDAQFLVDMIYADGTSRSSKVRGPDRYDSGYSSPATPDMAHGTSSPKSSTRYKIVAEPDTVLVEPDIPPSSSSRYPRGYSPPHPPHTPDRPPMSTRGSAKPTRSHTAHVPGSSSSRYEKRPPPGSLSARPLFSQVDCSSPRSSKEKDIKYAREYGPDRVMYSSRDPYHPRAYPYEDCRRRQSAYA